MNLSDQKEEAIVNAALELPPGKRQAHLESSCADDPELLHRVSSRLLVQELSAQAEGKNLGYGPNKTVIVTPTEKIGDKIGKYRLIQQIGEGGFGVVYLAEQEEPQRRLVALKVIKLGMDTKEVVTRFQIERHALALMDHPNIAKVLDAGATDAGRPYFVMDLVRGIPITDFCDQNNLTVQERIELFMQVCRAIQHAHQKAIIHRDIKPSNILVAVSHSVAMPMVIDFGLAKATAGQRLGDKTAVTAMRQFIGTLSYASPEQVQMHSRDVDTRSDIYSLGVTLYELLVGKTPFEVSNDHPDRDDEMRRCIRQQEPPLPSRRLAMLPEAQLREMARNRSTEPAKLISLIRGDLDWILIKTLEKDRARRYETANGLAMDLQRHLDHEPVAARPPGNLYRLQKLARRHKVGVTLACLLLLALVAGLSLCVTLLVQEKRANRQALAEADKSRHVARFLTDMIKGVEPSVAMGLDTTLLRETLDRTSERIGQDLKNQPDVEAELRSSIGEVYAAIGDYQKADAMQRQALALRRSLFGNEHPLVAESFNDLADTLRAEGKLADAEPLFRSALAMRRKLLGKDSPAAADSLQSYSGLLQDRGDVEDAEAALTECLSIRDKQMPDDWLTADTRSILGGVMMDEKKYSDAEPLITGGFSALEARQSEIPGEFRPHLRAALMRQIKLYHLTNRPDLEEKSEAKLRELDKPVSMKPDAGR